MTKVSLESDTSSKRRARMSTTSNAGVPPGPDARYSHVHNASDISFSGISSFGAVRTRFEFGPNTSCPEYFEASVPSHGRHESLYSIASISSYGEVIRDSLKDPFHLANLAITEWT
ncbi:MAG TPA: hypothetical protein VGO47_09660 [Chlamydiales bacterium]|nr:hypothetical protein [Chlamydiales bacterium]